MTAISDPFTLQRRNALERANETRLAQARIKLNIMSMSRLEGCRLVAAMLDDPTGFVPSMRVGHLLHAPSRVGGKSVRKWLGKAQVGSADRRVSELSARQRVVLAGLLREFADRA